MPSLSGCPPLLGLLLDEVSGVRSFHCRLDLQKHVCHRQSWAVAEPDVLEVGLQIQVESR